MHRKTFCSLFGILIAILLITGCSAGVPVEEAAPQPVAHNTPSPSNGTAAQAQPAAARDPVPEWIWTARIATASSSDWDGWTAEVDTAVAAGATVILGWDRFQGASWQTLFEPDLSEALAETRQRAQWIHATYPGVRYIIYMAPLEATMDGIDCDGDGQVDAGKEGDSLALQHPDWAQVGVDGREAVFYGSQPGMPFWVCPSCEDVWLTPANAEFRALTINQIQRLAVETELDGIWHDVPFLMGGYFGVGWPEGQFTGAGPDARALFSAETGYILPEPPFTPDWHDPAWQHFLAWRYDLINSYLNDIQAAIVRVNPDFAFIPESSVGFDAHMTQLAASPVDLPAFSHTTAHELSGTARPVQYYSWLKFISTLQAWRQLDLACGEPSWLLSYVESGHPDTLDVARLHAATTELSGFRTLLSGDEGMTENLAPEFRRALYEWMNEYGAPLSDPELRPYARLAVVFSQQTLDYVGHGSWDEEYSANFYGTLMILLESHIPFQVITDSDLTGIQQFELLILPGMQSLSDAQAEQIRTYVQGGGQVLATGCTSRLDEYGNARSELALADVFDTTLAGIEAHEGIIYEHNFGAGLAVLSPEPHEQYYYWEANPEAEQPDNVSVAEFERSVFLELLARFDFSPGLQTDAPRSVLLLPYISANGGIQVAVINLSGVGLSNAVPTPAAFTLTLDLTQDPVRPAVSWLELLGTPVDVTAIPVEGTQISLPVSVDVGGLVRIEVD